MNEIRLAVPFFANTQNDCGPVTVQMVLDYFGESHAYEEISKLALSESTGVTMTLGLAKAAAELGFPVELYSTSLGFNPANFQHEYYQECTDGVQSLQEKMRILQQSCVTLNVTMRETSLSLQNILDKISDDCVSVLLFDWSKIVHKEKYLGHFMVLVGYDQTHIYLHQPGPKDPTPYFKITKEMFDLARKAPGTDEDILFIYRKQGSNEINEAISR